MANQITFKILTEDICRTISQEHHLRFIKSDPIYRSQPPIVINKFTKPKETHNVKGDGHCTYHAVCYAISGSEISFQRIKLLAADEIHENGDKYQFIPHDQLEKLESETRSLNPVDWGGESQLIALSGKLHVPIYVFDSQLPNPEWLKMQIDTWPFNPIQVFPVSLFNMLLSITY